MSNQRAERKNWISLNILPTKILRNGKTLSKIISIHEKSFVVLLWILSSIKILLTMLTRKQGIPESSIIPV